MPQEKNLNAESAKPQRRSKSAGAFFQKLGKGFVGFFVNIGKSLAKSWDNACERFTQGSIWTKLSHLIMGLGNLARKQIVKGCLYLLIEIGFLYIMIFSPKINGTPFGAKAIVNFFTLGTVEGDIFTVGDNSMLMLLFGVVTFGMILMFLFAYISNLKSSYKTDLDIARGKKPTTIREDWKSLLDQRFHVLMLTPAIIGILVFTVLPTVFMILIAFTNFDSAHPAGLELFDWVGFQNFRDIFNGTSEISARFVPVLAWTLVWAFFATITCYAGGILLALLINKKGIKFKKVWRTIFILTIALPQFVSLLAMRNLLSSAGPINQILINLGIIDQGIEFLGNANASQANLVRVVILLINMWIGIPYTMLMTSGILMNIPTDLFEAATIDGANKKQIFWNVTVPYIVFVTTPYLITSFVGNITSFNVIYLLTGGAPTFPGYKAGYTDLLVTWLYKLTIDEAEYNIGSVIAIFTFILTATGTLLAYRNSKAYKEEDTFQ